MAKLPGFFSLSEYLINMRYEIINKTNKRRFIVLGNESCDLDSVCCSISYAYYKQKSANKDEIYFPLLCIKKEEMPLRTEVTYFLNKHRIDWHFLFYLDHLDIVVDEDSFEKTSLILVDHFKPIDRFAMFPIVGIIDHHPLPSSFELPKVKHLNHGLHGSCSTLVAQEIIHSHKDSLESIDKTIFNILYGAMLIDTIGLSEAGRECGKLTDLDFKTGQQIEKILDINEQDRKAIFELIEEAKFNVGGLKIQEILIRDMKLAISDNKEKRIIVSTASGVDLDNFVSRCEFKSDADITCCQYNTPYLICATVLPTEKCRLEKRKGIIIYSVDPNLYPINKIVETLTLDENNLQIEQVTNLNFEWKFGKNQLFLGRVGNLKFSRKMLIPIVIRMLSESEDFLTTNFNSNASSNKVCNDRMINWISLLSTNQIECLFGTKQIGDENVIRKIKESLMNKLDIKEEKNNKHYVKEKLWMSDNRLPNYNKNFNRMRRLTLPEETEDHARKMSTIMERNIVFSLSDQESYDSLPQKSCHKISKDLSNLNYMEALGGSGYIVDELISNPLMETPNPNDLAEANSFNLFSRIKRARRNTTGGVLIHDLHHFEDVSSDAIKDKLNVDRKSESIQKDLFMTNSEKAMLKVTRERVSSIFSSTTEAESNITPQ